MDFKIYEQAYEMFRQNNCIGQYNTIFVALKDTTDAGIQAGLYGGIGGALGGAIAYAATNNNGNSALANLVYDGLLINQTEHGFGFIPLSSTGIAFTSSLSKFIAKPNEFFFVGNNYISKVEVKNWALINKKVKKIRFYFSNGEKIKLMARLEQKDVPYQFQNLSTFVSRFQIK